MAEPVVLAIDINPMNWLGDAAGKVSGDAWKSAMTGLWSAGLWLMKTAFRLIDSFTTPDVSGSGPLASVLPTTLWIGASLAGILMFVQLALALVRRDGESMGRILLGIVQFGFVWVSYLAIAAVLVSAAGGLTHGILSSMLHVQSLSDFSFDESWPKSVDDVTLATVLGVLSLLLVIPASFFYLVIMLVREAALIILVATAPIAAAGLLGDTGKVWFWKSLRWFFACLLIPVCAALLLGVGVKLSEGAISPPAAGATTTTATSAGMAIIGVIVIAIGAVCPMILFRLLAFVEPGTASGAALRQSWSDAGGMSGVAAGSGAGSGGTSAAAASGADGRATGESSAEAQTMGRLSSAMGTVGRGMQAATSIAHKAADLGSDVLGSAGVGSPGYSMTPTDERATRRGSVPGGGGSTPGAAPSGGGADQGVPPAPAAPPPLPASPAGGSVPAAAMPGGAGAATGEAGAAEAAAVVAL